MKKLIGLITSAAMFVEMLRLLHLHAAVPHPEKEEHEQPTEPPFTISARGGFPAVGIGYAEVSVDLVGVPKKFT